MSETWRSFPRSCQQPPSVRSFSIQIRRGVTRLRVRSLLTYYRDLMLKHSALGHKMSAVHSPTIRSNTSTKSESGRFKSEVHRTRESELYLFEMTKRMKVPTTDRASSGAAWRSAK
jgi:hypothetical protein